MVYIPLEKNSAGHFHSYEMQGRKKAYVNEASSFLGQYIVTPG
jgi:hypothetical protein